MSFRNTPKVSVSNARLGNVVRPLVIGEKSVIESVVDFFQDVIPNQTHTGDSKEKIIWVKLDQFGFAKSSECRNKSEPCHSSPMIILGFTTGVQVWLLQSTGEACEVLSLRQNKIKVFTIIVSSESDSGPLAAICDDDRGDERHAKTQPFSHLKLFSLADGGKVWEKRFSSTINNIHSNELIFLVSVHRRIAAFYIHNQQGAFTISGCFPTDGLNMNPLSLGSAWLAYAESRLIPHLQSNGEVQSEAGLSYTATALNTAKNVTNSLLATFGDGRKSQESDGLDSDHRLASGVVTVVDVTKLVGHFQLSDRYSGDAVVCHFKALSHRIAFLQFDQSGTLLFATDREGQNFHIFRILSHPVESSHAAFQHLYILHRGDTSAVVQDVTFNTDGRWVAVCTARGTTHVYPINPYGGIPNVRTHTGKHVVNKTSKFQKSAGIYQMKETGDSKIKTDTFLPKHNFQGSLENPRLQPYVNTVNTNGALVQIKQPLRLPAVGSAGVTTTDRYFCGGNIAARFSVTRGRMRHGSGLQEKASEMLCVMCDNGTLVEYALEPYYNREVEKITEDTALCLAVTMKAQWNLGRHEQSPCINRLLPTLPSKMLQSKPRSLSDITGSGLNTRYGSKESISSDTSNKSGDFDDPWLSQVEILTHEGPNRRLWMGPQFKFKVYQSNSSFVSSQSPALFSTDTEDIAPSPDMICEAIDLNSLQVNPQNSSPVLIENKALGNRESSVGEIRIEAGSFDPPPNLGSFETPPDVGMFDPLYEVKAKPSHLAEAMLEAMQDPSIEVDNDSEDLMVFN